MIKSIKDIKPTYLWGIAARVGVQKYPEGDCFRSFEEVKKSAKTLMNCPLTVGHVRNIKDEAYKVVGKVSDTYFDEFRGLLLVQLEISPLGLSFITNRNYRELSVGYNCKVEPKNGFWIDTLGITGQVGKQLSYDFIQTEITCDHLALCMKARAGSVASLFFCDSHINSTMENNNTIQTLLLGLHTGMEKLGGEIERLLGVKESITELADSVVVMRDSIALIEGELKAPVTAIVETVTAPEPIDIQSSILAEVNERLKVAKIIGDSADLTLNAVDMKRAYLGNLIKNHETTLAFENYSTDSIDACFNLAQILSVPNVPKTVETIDNRTSLKDSIAQDTQHVPLVTHVTDVMESKISQQRKANRKPN